jgi:integrase/recombinase XerD
MRHTTAVHLRRAGVAMHTIRAWLGHGSLDTTHLYAASDLDMQAKALAHCEGPSATAWHKEPDLMACLPALSRSPWKTRARHGVFHVMG